MTELLRSQLIKSIQVEVDDEAGTVIEASFPIPAVTPSLIDRAEVVYYGQLLGDDEEDSDEDLDSLDTEGLDDAQVREVAVARMRRVKTRAEKRLTQAASGQPWHKAVVLLDELGVTTSLLDDTLDPPRPMCVSVESVTGGRFPWLWVWPVFRAVFFGVRPKATNSDNSNST